MLVKGLALQVQAIAVCRVSTPEQTLSGSLTRQEKSVHKAAQDLETEIVRFWSGDISSKHGTNLDRPDLKEMLAFCKVNRAVEYLIVDEPDRFMRSIDEAFYFEVMFRELEVKVWYASDPALNTDDMMAKMLRFMKYFQAEGSNEERQRKSITGHVAAIKEGRYTFPPKPGYMKSLEPGIHIPNPNTFIPLQNSFRDVLSGLYTPLEALKRLNESNFTKTHGAWRMDKFRKFATDPFYAGVIELNKQVKARNECGRHRAMLSLEDHRQLLQAFNGTIIPRGPKKQYNPEFPMSKILRCGDCSGNIKFTGSKKNNGYAKKVTKFYFKYHCRGCGKGYHRHEVHQAITETLGRITYSGTQRKDFLEALATVWEKKQHDKLQTIKAHRVRLDKLSETKSALIIEMAQVEEKYKTDIKTEIDNIKAQITTLEIAIEESSDLQEDLMDFMKFALEYTNMLARDWWTLDHDDRIRCQQLIIPGGILFNSQKKVGTPKISAIYSLEPNKKALRFDRKALMEELAGTAPASAGLPKVSRLQA